MRSCSIDSCEGKLKAKGMCDKHYMRMRRNGDPLNPGRYEYKRGVRKYSSAHEFVIAAKGRAAEHNCLHCGEQARDWAYNHEDPNEVEQYRKQTKAVVAYSMHAEYYIPLCKHCHLEFDRN